MQSFWRNYKDGVLLAFILATGLGVLYDHGVSGQESVVPTAGLLIITFSNVTLSAWRLARYYQSIIMDKENWGFRKLQSWIKNNK